MSSRRYVEERGVCNTVHKEIVNIFNIYSVSIPRYLRLSRVYDRAMCEF